MLAATATWGNTKAAIAERRVRTPVRLFMVFAFMRAPFALKVEVLLSFTPASDPVGKDRENHRNVSRFLRVVTRRPLLNASVLKESKP